MSGVKRAILAELANKGIKGEFSQKALSPENFRKETGRSVLSPSSKKSDDGMYLGKKGKDATK